MNQKRQTSWICDSDKGYGRHLAGPVAESLAELRSTEQKNKLVRSLALRFVAQNLPRDECWKEGHCTLSHDQ
jgi:hypothetical protein